MFTKMAPFPSETANSGWPSSETVPATVPSAAFIAANSNYPLFIVASEDRKRKVCDELRGPTFSGPCLRLNEVIRFLGYRKLRDIDESSKRAKDFDIEALLAASESVSPIA